MIGRPISDLQNLESYPGEMFFETQSFQAQYYHQNERDFNEENPPPSHSDTEQIPTHLLTNSEQEKIQNQVKEEQKQPQQASTTRIKSRLRCQPTQFIEYPKALYPENLKSILVLVKQKYDENLKSAYGNDEICKKIIRKLVDNMHSEFCKFQDQDYSVLEGELILNKFLQFKGYKLTVKSPEELKFLKSVLFSLRLRRQDPIFGPEERRGKNSRNEFIHKGTKKAALDFFKFPSMRYLFWGDFDEAINASISLMQEEGKSEQQKLVNLLGNLKRKLERQTQRYNLY